MTQRKDGFSLQCAEVREELSARLDGETDDVRFVGLQAHLDDCADCAAFDVQLRSFHERLRDELTDFCDVDQLLRRIKADIVENDADAAVAPGSSPLEARRRTVSRRWMAVAAAAVLLVGVFAGGRQILRPEAGDLPIISETVRDFETFRIRGGILDIATDEPDQVRRWIATKVDFRLPSDVAPPGGLKIVGGRLCSFLNRRLAFFHYEKGPSDLSLYVMNASGLTLPSDGAFDTGLSRDGLATVTWRTQGLVFVVVSDLPLNEVAAIASRFMDRGVTDGSAPS